MKLLLPRARAEALTMLSETPDAVPLAGGTDVLVHWPTRPAEHDRTYLDLSGCADLKGVRWTDDTLELGALATYWDVITDRRAAQRLPLLGVAARQVGAVQIQSRGTWAGNIANASPAADGVPVLMAYDAVVVLESVRGREDVPLAEFYLGYKRMRRAADQLVVAIRVPLRAYDRQRFAKIGSRRAQAIAKIGLAITRSAAGWCVVAASMAPTIRRCRAVEARLAAGPVPGAGELLPAIDQDVTPIDDIRSTARYRRHVMARVLFDAIRS